MNIYFAGSIRGGREKQKDYYELIEYIKNFGTVLTEHIGNEDTDIKEEKKYSDKFDEHIYLRDVDWINRSELLIAEVTIPSLGVGYEIGYAEALNKDILCIYDVNGDKKVSAMLSGNSNLIVKGYSNIEEAKRIVKEYMENK